jgi:hypothetical protein
VILLLVALASAEDHHVVRPGESLASIAAAAGVDPARVAADNGLTPGTEPAVGTILRLPGDTGGNAMVLALSGSGTVTLPGGAPTPLAEGIPLPPGARVCTNTNSFATLRLATRTDTHAHDEVSLLAGTCLTLDALAASGDTRASLVSMTTGSVAVRSADDGRGEVTVQTGAGVTTGEGGGFRVTVEAGAARTEALVHDVAVLGAGAEVDVPAGNGSRVRNGAAPTAPVPLLPPGGPTAPDDGATLLRPDFAWTPVDRALGYRIEVATDPGFADIVLVEDVASPAFRPDTLFLPYRVPGLWWRVSSFDRTGFLGAPSSPRRAVPPVGIGP